MTQGVQVLVKHIPDREEEEMDLLLLTDDGTIWQKRFYGKLFLMLDAQALNLIEHRMETATGDEPRDRLREHGEVRIEDLLKLDFCHCGREC